MTEPEEELGARIVIESQSQTTRDYLILLSLSLFLSPFFFFFVFPFFFVSFNPTRKNINCYVFLRLKKMIV